MFWSAHATRVLAQDFPPQDYEVIVVMDGSTDDTAELLRDLKPKCSLRVLESQHLGAGAARNLGIRAAVGELVLFLDEYSSRRQVSFGSTIQHMLEPIQAWYKDACYIAPDSSQTIIRNAIERIGVDYYARISPDMGLRFPEGMSSVYVLSYLVNSSMPAMYLYDVGGFDEQFLAAKSWT